MLAGNCIITCWTVFKPSGMAMQQTPSFCVLALTLLLILSPGCTLRTGHLTAISTKDLKTSVRRLNVVRGEDCASLLFGFIPITSTLEPTIERATSNALYQSNANILLDVEISRTIVLIPLVYTEVCEVVEGIAAQIHDRTS